MLIFTLGQIIVKFIIEPIHNQAKLIGEITGALTFFANTGGSAMVELYLRNIVEMESRKNEIDTSTTQLEKERYQSLILEHWRKADSASELFRRQASDLLATTHAIPFYAFWSLWRQAPSFENVLSASSELVGLSNSVHNRDSDFDKAQRIAGLLGLRVILKR